MNSALFWFYSTLFCICFLLNKDNLEYQPRLIRFILRDLRESNGSVTLIIVLKVRQPSLMTVIPNANLRRISLRCNFLDKFLAAPAEVFSFIHSKFSAKLWCRCAKYCQRQKNYNVVLLNIVIPTIFKSSCSKNAIWDVSLLYC